MSYVDLHVKDGKVVATTTSDNEHIAELEEQLKMPPYIYGKMQFNKGMERAAELARTNKLVSGSIGPLFDAGWSSCQKATEEAIRKEIT